MATSEYCSCPPRLPTPTASHVAIASGVNHRVTSPRWTRARSYAGQFPTRYFVLYLGCTLDFTSRSCPFGRHDGQGRDEYLFPRTNATNYSTSSSQRTASTSWRCRANTTRHGAKHGQSSTPCLFRRIGAPPIRDRPIRVAVYLHDRAESIEESGACEREAQPHVADVDRHREQAP